MKRRTCAGPRLADDALHSTGGFARGAHVVRRLHVSAVKATYLVERCRDRFVMRVDTPVARALALDRRAELRILRTVWRAGLAPEPIVLAWHRPQDAAEAVAVLVTRYVPGRAWSAADLAVPRNLRRLAALLRELHALPPGGVRRLDLPAALARYACLAGSAAAQATARRAARLAQACLAAPAALCHNDLVAPNVVGRRRPFLIDWEYAAAGDPLFDLAVILRHHRLPAGAAARFTAAYFGGPSRVPRERLRQCCVLYHEVLRLWTLAVETSAQRLL